MKMHEIIKFLNFNTDTREISALNWNSTGFRNKNTNYDSLCQSKIFLCIYCDFTSCQIIKNLVSRT